MGSPGSAVAVSGRTRQPPVLAVEEPRPRWGCVLTKANQERYAVKNLENQGFEAFCPLEGRPKRGEPLTSVLVPLFPCYAFVLVDPDRQRWRSIDWTYGVIRLLTDRNRENPRPLFADDVDARVNAALARLRASVAAPFSPGTVVRVRHRSNPFYDHEGTVAEMDRHMRIRVMLSMFNRDTEVWFDDPTALEEVASG